MPNLLHEDPMALPAPTNHLRMKCEKTQINNSFELIRDKDVPYSTVVKNIAAKETTDILKVFAMFFIYILYIQFGVSKKA